MTKQEAKALTIKVWKWLAAHPDENKWGAGDIFPELVDCAHECPLCDLFNNHDLKENQICKGCPLHVEENFYGCLKESGKDAYNIWLNAEEGKDRETRNEDRETRTSAALRMVSLTEKWEIDPEEEEFEIHWVSRTAHIYRVKAATGDLACDIVKSGKVDEDDSMFLGNEEMEVVE